MRLIDADALRDLMEQICWDRVEMRAVQKTIDEQPTIDPVKHGKWVKISDRNYKCSCCNAWWSVDRDSTMKDFKHCPHCGARMEADE